MLLTEEIKHVVTLREGEREGERRMEGEGKKGGTDGGRERKKRRGGEGTCCQVTRLSTGGKQTSKIAHSPVLAS